MTWRAVALATVLAALACHRGTTDAGEIAATQTPRPLDPGRLRYASLLLRGREATPDEWARWSQPRATVEAIVGEMLDDPFVSEVVAPRVLFRNVGLHRPEYVVVSGFTLERAAIGGSDVFYLHDRCKPGDVVEVAPWWALSTTVKVCRDSIRADVWEATTADGRTMPCDSELVEPSVKGSHCRCGPNLLRCNIPELLDAIQLGAANELYATTTAVVAANEPLAQVFTGNETARNKTTELFYLRNLAESQRLADPTPLLRRADGWPAAGKRAPRDEVEPGQHAGVLTAPGISHYVADTRQRSRIMYEVMWCTGGSAPGAKPEDVLSLHTPNLSNQVAGWKELAARPICTACHARLDYGMQFFQGHTHPVAGPLHFVAGVTTGQQGPIYGGSISDPRGSGPLTAHGFAELVTAEPEFARCMARDVGEYVFGPRVASATIDRLAGSAPAQALRFRDLMAAAVIEFVRCQSCPPPGSLERDLAAAPPARDQSLGALIDEHCSYCHADDSIFDLDRPLALTERTKVLDQVLFGRMPPTGSLPAAVRAQFLAASVADRGSASDLLRVAADPPPALPMIAVRHYLDRQAGGDPTVPARQLNIVENALDGKDSMFTPSYAALTALEAFRRCKGAPAGRDACVETTLDAVWLLGSGPDRSPPPALPK